MPWPEDNFSNSLREQISHSKQVIKDQRRLSPSPEIDWLVACHQEVIEVSENCLKHYQHPALEPL